MSRRLRLLAPAKLNLGLEVLSKRSDGYHEVRTVLQAVRLFDRVDLETSREPGITLSVSPRRLDIGPVEANLAVRAARLLEPPKGAPPGVHIHLVKRIPAGAGMGGGSSDAAAVLVGLDRLWKLGLSAPRLRALAARLGSDVPFFLDGGTQLGVGRGERLRPFSPCPRGTFVVAKPPVPAATAAVYSNLNLKLTALGPLSSLSPRSFQHEDWTDAWLSLHNDLEAAVRRLVPEVELLAKRMQRLGSPFVRVTGSGSGVFALAPDSGAGREWVARLRASGYWSRSVSPFRGGCAAQRENRPRSIGT